METKTATATSTIIPFNTVNIVINYVFFHNLLGKVWQPEELNQLGNSILRVNALAVNRVNPNPIELKYYRWLVVDISEVTPLGFYKLMKFIQKNCEVDFFERDDVWDEQIANLAPWALTHSPEYESLPEVIY